MNDSIERHDAARAFTRSRADCAELVVASTPDFSSFAGGRNAASLLLERGSGMTALIAASDQIAFGAMTLLRERGIRVPQDVAVTGFDNAVIARTSGGGITTLDQNIEALASMAYGDVLRRCSDASIRPARLRCQPTLIERESTGGCEAPAPPTFVERGDAQDYLVASEEVSLAASGGRHEYLWNYLIRLQSRLAFASVVRVSRDRRTLLPVGSLPLAIECAGEGPIPVANYLAPWLRRSEMQAGDLAVVMVQEGLPDGTECVALGFSGTDLRSALAVETLVHEMDLFFYQLQAKAMSDELQRTIAALRTMQDELLRSEKHAALGAVIVGIAHEMNTPLGNSLLATTTLANLASSMRDQLAHGQIRRSAIDQFLNEIESASALVDRNVGKALKLVGDFKRIRGEHIGGETELVGMREFIDETIDVLRVRCDRAGVSLHGFVDGDIRVQSNRQVLAQVLSELVDNALIHGLVDVVGGAIRISACAGPSGGCMLTVSDNGAGIGSAMLERVFDPFVTSQMGGMSGLGLTMVSNLVDGELSGRVWAEPNSTGGVRFLIHLR